MQEARIKYKSFINKEAYQAIEEWMDFRRKSGEKITGESWLVRNLWDVTTPSGGPRGLISVPKQLGLMYFLNMMYTILHFRIYHQKLLSNLVGKSFLNVDQSSFSISSNCLKEGIVRPFIQKRDA